MFYYEYIHLTAINFEFMAVGRKYNEQSIIMLIIDKSAETELCVSGIKLIFSAKQQYLLFSGTTFAQSLIPN